MRRARLEIWATLGQVVPWLLGCHPLCIRVGIAAGTRRFCQLSGDHCTGRDEPGLMQRQEAQSASGEEMGLGVNTPRTWLKWAPQAHGQREWISAGTEQDSCGLLVPSGPLHRSLFITLQFRMSEFSVHVCFTCVVFLFFDLFFWFCFIVVSFFFFVGCGFCLFVFLFWFDFSPVKSALASSQGCFLLMMVIDLVSCIQPCSLQYHLVPVLSIPLLSSYDCSPLHDVFVLQ